MIDFKICAYDPCKKVFYRTNQTGSQWTGKRFCSQRCQSLYNYHKDEQPRFKTCLRCHQEKHIFQFHRNGSKGDGHTSYCKKCKQEMYAESKKKTMRSGNEALAQDMSKTLHLKALLSMAWE